MKKIGILILGVIMFNNLTAQTPLQKADSVFNKNKDYYNSITLYNKALKKATSEETKYIYFQIGECYRNGNKYTEALSYYQKAINAGYNVPAVDLHMGEMLTLSGDYSGAKTYIEKYITEVPTDNIAKKRLEACELGLKVQKEKPLYEVKIQKDFSSTSGDYGIAYFKNDKVIFSSTRMEGANKYDPATTQGYSDMYESTYDLQKSQWSKPGKLNGSINTGFNEGTFSFDPALYYGYYTQCNGASGKLLQCNIMYAHYNETLNKWEDSKLFDFNSQTFRIQHPALSSDGNSIYFSSDMPGGYGGADIYVIKKVGTTWGKPENLGPTINTIGNEGFPFFSGDTLLVFASDGQTGFGGLDIFMSSYKNGVFSTPVNMMPPINSSADDFNLVFKNSKKEGFFSSNRPGGVGDDDIYTYDLIPVILTATGNVKDKATNKNLEDATVVFIGSDGSVDSVYTDTKGNYIFTKLKPNVKYNIKAGKKGYLNDSRNLIVGNELYSKSYNVDFTLIKITPKEIKIDNIYYDYDKWDLREESKIGLDTIINILKENPDVNIQISAHTDERGAKDYNIELSQKRAQSVVNYLIAGGINTNRLVAKGYGFSMPLYKNAKTEEQHQMNRRTTFKILNSEDIGKILNSGYTRPVYNEIKPSATTTPVTTNITGNATTTNTSFTPTTKSTIPVTPVTTSPSSNVTTATSTNNTVVVAATENKFFIISGSFPTEQKAVEGVSALKAAGFSKAEVVGKAANGFWRIAYIGFKTNAEALTELAKIKQTYPTAWIFEKK